MKSLGILIFCSFLVSCKGSKSGQNFRDFGPLQAYERNMTFELEACGESWEQLDNYTAKCVVDQFAPSHFVWNSGRIIRYWEYTDNIWSADISVYYTDNGFMARLIGFKSEPREHFDYEVAKKYIESALVKFKSKPTKQIVLVPYGESAPSKMNSLGSVELVNRSVNLQNENLLRRCKRNWKNGECYIDLLNGTYREGLLEMENIELNISSLYARSSGLLAWKNGSGLSDYKLYLGSRNKNMSFSNFKSQWRKTMPNRLLNLKVQKFSKHRARDYYNDRFIRFIDMKEWKKITHQ